MAKVKASPGCRGTHDPPMAKGCQVEMHAKGCFNFHFLKKNQDSRFFLNMKLPDFKNMMRYPRISVGCWFVNSGLRKSLTSILQNSTSTSQ